MDQKTKAAVLGVAALAFVGAVGYIGYKVVKGDATLKVRVIKDENDKTTEAK